MRLKTASRELVYHAISVEREYQLGKYGRDKEQSLPGYLLIIRKELEEAELAWLKGGSGRDSAMSEILQIAATAVAALESYGVCGCPRSTNDNPVIYTNADENASFDANGAPV